MHRVFISHSRHDKDFAVGLATHLRETAATPWLAEFEISPGQMVTRAVEAAIASCDRAVIIIGSADESSWARREWSMLLEARWKASLTTLVGAIVGDAETPGFLYDAHVVRIDGGIRSWPEGFSAISRALSESPPRLRDDSVQRKALASRLERLRQVSLSSEAESASATDMRRELENLLVHTTRAELSDVDRARYLQQLARLDVDSDDHRQASVRLTEALALSAAASGSASPQTLGIRYDLAIAAGSDGRVAEAIDMLWSLLADARDSLGRNHPLAAAAMYHCALFIASKGDPEAAVALLTQAAEIGEHALGARHPTARAYRQALEELRN